jgi:hypothetical protein
MIQVIFDFNNNLATYREGERTTARQIKIRDTDKWTQIASFAFTTTDDRRISASWKVWNKFQQFVTLEELDMTDKFDQRWRTVANWSFIDRPQAGQTSEVQGQSNGHSVMVVGSEYGDWLTI